MCILMGIDLSGKFSSKTKKAMKLLGNALRLGSSKPIEFKSKIDATSVNRGNNSDGQSDEQVNIKNVQASTNDTQLKANIKAMVKNAKNINEIDLKHFFGNDGILACLSNSSFTSSSSYFKKIYESINQASETLLMAEVNTLNTTEQVADALTLLLQLRNTLTTYLTRTKRNNYKDSASKFNDGGTIDKCKVVACHTLLLGLKQKEEKLKKRQEEFQQSPQSSSTSNSISQYTPLDDLDTELTNRQGMLNRTFCTEIKKIQSIHPENKNKFIYAYDTTQTAELIKTLTKIDIHRINPTDITIYTLKNRNSLTGNYILKSIYIPKTSSPTNSSTKTQNTTYTQNKYTPTNPYNFLQESLQTTHHISIFINTELFEKIAKNEKIQHQIHQIIFPDLPQHLSSEDHPYQPNCPETNFINAMSAKTTGNFLTKLDTNPNQTLIQQALGYIIVTVKPSDNQFEMPCQTFGDQNFVTDLDTSLQKRTKYTHDPNAELTNMCQENALCPVIFVQPNLFDSIARTASDRQEILTHIAKPDNNHILTEVPPITELVRRCNITNFSDLTPRVIPVLKLPEIKTYITAINSAIEQNDYINIPKPPTSLSNKALDVIKQLLTQTQASRRNDPTNKRKRRQKPTRLRKGMFSNPAPAQTGNLRTNPTTNHQKTNTEAHQTQHQSPATPKKQPKPITNLNP